MSSDGLYAYQTTFNKQDLSCACVYQEGPTPVPFELCGASTSVRIDGWSAVLSVTQEFRHNGKTPCGAIFASPIPDHMNLLCWTASNGRHTVKCRTVSEPSAFSSDTLTAKVPFRTHPGDIVTTTATFYASLTGESPLSASLWIPRTLLGVAAPQLSEWDRHFALTSASTLKGAVALDVQACAPTTIDRLVVAGLDTPDPTSCVKDCTGTASWQGRAGAKVLWGEKVTVTPTLSGAASSGEAAQLMSVEVVRPAGSTHAVDAADTHVLLATVHATPQALAGAGVDAADYAQPNVEYVFMLDVSGGDAGPAWVERAVEAATYAIMALPPSAAFNICLYGAATSVEGGTPAPTALLSDAASLDNTSESVSQARRFLSALTAYHSSSASLGKSLRVVYSLPVRRGYGRHVVLIGNSPVSDAADCLHMCRDHGSSTRLHCVGGPRVAAGAFATGVAAACSGLVRLVSTEEALGGTEPDGLVRGVLDVVDATCKPCLAEAEIFFCMEGIDEERFSASLSHIRPCYHFVPLLVAGERCVLAHFASVELRPQTTVAFCAVVGGKDLRLTDHLMTLDTSNPAYREAACTATGAPVAHVGAAVARVGVLLQHRWHVDASGLFGGRTRVGPQETEEAVRLSKQYGFVTQFTTMVGDCPTLSGPAAALPVATGPRCALGDARASRLTGRLSGALANSALYRADDGSALAPGEPPPQAATATAATAAAARADGSCGLEAAPGFVRELVMEELLAAVCGVPRLRGIFALQDSDGSWSLSAQACRCLGVGVRAMRKSVPSVDECTDEQANTMSVEAGCEAVAQRTYLSTLWCTAAFLSHLAAHHKTNATVVPPLARKGRAFLESRGCADWTNRARDFLKENSVHPFPAS